MHAVVPPVGRARCPGFTLVEIMVVVVIVGLLAALAIPAFQRTQRASRNARVASDLRVFTQAFEIYNTQHGGWPESAGPGVVPTLPESIADTLRASSWQAATTLGGNWQWDNALDSGGEAGISLVNVTCSDEQLRELDTKVDDGDPAAGRFRRVSATQLFYSLAASP